MGYHAVRPDELVYQERESPGGPARQAADITTAAGLHQSRARVWRYPPGARGRRHADLVQEEVFVVPQGTLTMLLGEPWERVDVPAGGLVAVEPRTPLQVRNEGTEELVLYVYGAPAEQGGATPSTTYPSVAPHVRR